MKVKLPLEPWSNGPLPGKIVLVGGPSSSHYSFSAVWDGGEAALLNLEGERAGEMDAFNYQGTLVSADNVELRVSRKSSNWTVGLPPTKALLVGYRNEQLFFVFRAGQHNFGVNAETGVVGPLLGGGYYTAAWGIYEEGAEEPFIGSAVIS